MKGLGPGPTANGASLRRISEAWCMEKQQTLSMRSFLVYPKTFFLMMIQCVV